MIGKINELESAYSKDTLIHLKKLVSELDKPKVIAVVGDTGQGKTTKIIELIQQKNWGCIVIDENYQENYDDISYNLDNIKALQSWNRERGIVRVRGHNIIVKMRETFKYYTENKITEKRIAVILEDCSEYIETPKQISSLRGMCGAVRHANAHIFLMFHDLTGIPTRLKSMLQGIILFKTKDPENYFRRPRNFRNEELIAEAFTKLQRAKNHSYITIDL